MPAEKDYIGFDPLAWLDRLIEVNRGSQFTPAQKEIIKDGLLSTKNKLFASDGSRGTG